MGYGVKIKVWGDYASFNRPELKVERVSYDVMTPSAARGILEAIYWKPAIRWVIDKIHVMKEIKFANIRRNEVKSKIVKQNAVRAAKENDGTGMEVFAGTSAERNQRAAMVLKDVEYIIEAHFELTDRAGETDDEKKHYNIALRRIRGGECFKQPCFGTREFSAFFEAVEGDAAVPESPLCGEVDLGYMLYDMEFSVKKDKKDKSGEGVIYTNDASPVFYRPKMINGVIDVAAYAKEIKK